MPKISALALHTDSLERTSAHLVKPFASSVYRQGSCRKRRAVTDQSSGIDTILEDIPEHSMLMNTNSPSRFTDSLDKIEKSYQKLNRINSNRSHSDEQKNSCSLKSVIS